MTHTISDDPEILITPLIAATPGDGGLVTALIRIRAPSKAPAGVVSGRYLSNIVIDLTPSDGVTIEPAGKDTTKRRWYSLPDLEFGSEVSHLIYLRVEPYDGSTRSLFAMKMRATSEIEQNMMVIGGLQLTLANIKTRDMAMLPHDGTVAAYLSRSGGQIDIDGPKA